MKRGGVFAGERALHDEDWGDVIFLVCSLSKVRGWLSGFVVTKVSQFGFGEMAKLCLYLASARETVAEM